MTSEDRREFLKTLARGAAYATPIVISMAAPVGLAAQGKASQHKGPTAATQQSPPSGNAVGGTPPWEAPPPGR